MTFKVFCIKASDEEIAKQVLPFFINEQDQWRNSGPDFSLVVLPSLYENDETFNQNGETIAPPTLIQGWHCDISAAEHLWNFIPQEFVVYPENRRHKFMGEA